MDMVTATEIQIKMFHWHRAQKNEKAKQICGYEIDLLFVQNEMRIARMIWPESVDIELVE